MQDSPLYLGQRTIDINPVKETLLKLLNNALKAKSLNEKEYNFIIKVMKVTPDILIEIGFGPDSIFELIEKNEPLASDILIHLSRSEGFENYMKLFLERKWSVNSIKAINKLIQHINFPPVFIRVYLKIIIVQFKNENNMIIKEKLGKLLSFFILNLLNHDHITFDMIPQSINLLFNEEYKDIDLLILKSKIYEYRRKNNNKNNI